MARNQAQDYATMDDDERRRFTGEPPAGDEPSELDFEEPRDEDNQGHSQVDRDTEVGDPEHRDGLAAQLDDEAHADAARRDKR
jgi:hypothetical protein